MHAHRLPDDRPATCTGHCSLLYKGSVAGVKREGWTVALLQLLRSRVFRGMLGYYGTGHNPNCHIFPPSGSWLLSHPPQVKMST